LSAVTSGIEFHIVCHPAIFVLASPELPNASLSCWPFCTCHAEKEMDRELYFWSALMLGNYSKEGIN
jgi:hypothetical protein